MSFNWDKMKFREMFDIEKYKINNLPDGIKISTISAVCKLGSNLHLDNIFKYLPLNSKDVLTVKRNNQNYRSLITIKEIKRRSKTEQEKKKTTSFQNSLSIVIRKNHHSVSKDELDLEGKINFKLFNNGSVQMSGCKDLIGLNSAMNKLVQIFRKGIYYNENGVNKKLDFAENPDNIDISDFRTSMINCNYRIRPAINREKLNNLLTKKKIKSSYEPVIRSQVIVEYKPKNDNPKNKSISISVFEQGNIIVTGANNPSQLIESINFINNIIVSHIHDIQKIILDDIINKTKYKELLIKNI